MANHPPTAQDRPFVLVLGLDLADQESSGYAFDEALRITSRIDASELHVVHVVRPETSLGARLETVGLLRLYVAEKAAFIGIDGPRQAGLHVRCGDAAEEIAQLSADLDADMIVVGTHRPPRMRNLSGDSTADRVTALTMRPVFVAGPRPKLKASHVVAIEPTCPECLDARFTSQGRVWSCARHSEHHARRHQHIYSYHTELPFSEHDSEVSATGTD